MAGMGITRVRSTMLLTDTRRSERSIDENCVKEGTTETKLCRLSRKHAQDGRLRCTSKMRRCNLMIEEG